MKESSGPCRRGIRRISMLVVICLVAYATRGMTLSALGRWLDVGQQPQHTDYVYLLNGDRDTRPFAVADLINNGFADRVIITSTDDKDTGLLKPRIHEVTRAILNLCGVHDDRIVFIDSRCDNTFDEAKVLQRFMESEAEATFTVVTNTFHSRRARWILSTVLGPQMDQVRMASAATDFYNADNWWKHEEGFERYPAELLKASFYFVRYGNGITWIAAIIGLLGLAWWHRRRHAVAAQAA